MFQNSEKLTWYSSCRFDGIINITTVFTRIITICTKKHVLYLNLKKNLLNQQLNIVFFVQRINIFIKFWKLLLLKN